MADIQGRVRELVRQELLQHGASPALNDPTVFADVDALLRAATERTHTQALLLPELLGEPDRWKLETAMRLQSHRGGAAAAFIVFVKRRLLLPLHRWLFEYSRDNFERQRRVNQVLFACVQELAIETARLRQQVQRGNHPQS
jgi:hypothetical protein